jgi:hypothetical protein
MSDYALTATDIVVRTADNANIPNDPRNVDRQAYEAWLADGGVPDPHVPPPQPEGGGPKIDAAAYGLTEKRHA